MTELYSVVSMHKRDAERLFSSCVFVLPEVAKQECGWLKPSSFHDTRYREFWADVLAGKDVAQAAIDAKVYTELLGAQLEISSNFNFAGFAKTIADDNWLLNVATSLTSMAGLIVKRDKEAIQTIIERLANQKTDGAERIPNAVDVALEFVELIGKETLSIDTYIPPLDTAIGGYVRKTLNIIAARPSMGKSTAAWQIARNMAAAKKRIIFFSLEMPSTTLWARAACGLAGVSWKQVIKNDLSDIEENRLIEASSSLMNVYQDYLLIDDRSRISTEDIWQAVATYKPDAIFVDHISLLSDQARTEIIRLGNITKTIKQIAKEYDCIAVCVAQLNRAVDKQENKRPTLSDLRDSGEIEQNADTILFLYQDDYYGQTENEQLASINDNQASKTEFIIAKNRDGVRNTMAIVYYDKKQQWFDDKETAMRKGTL